MKALIQRVQGRTEIECRSEEKKVKDFFEGVGLVVLLAWESQDTLGDLEKREDWILSRTTGLRIFPDKQGKMNLSLSDYLSEQNKSGGILWVSQFTLAAKLESGFRPSFSRALSPDRASERWENFLKKIPPSEKIKNIFGVFGSDMSLSFTNWGPVTIPLEI